MAQQQTEKETDSPLEKVEKELSARIFYLEEGIMAAAKSGHFTVAHELEIKRDTLKQFREILPEL